jgi:glycosyltransferase involved in cell wall biosynthesis
MRVMMVGPFGLQRKGTMRARALSLGRALAARGHTVTLLIPPWDSPCQAGRTWEEHGVRIVNVNLPPAVPLLYHLWLTWYLVRAALAAQPDVVHCFKPKAYSGLTHFALWWLRRLGLVRRTLRLVVDEDDWERAWNAVEPYSRVQKCFFARQERWGLRHADAVVVASRELERLVRAEGVPADRIVYVPNGVWPGAFERSEVRAQAARMLWELEDAPVVLLYSRFLEFRLTRIVTMLDLLRRREPRIRLFVVGEGLYAEESELDDLLAAAGLSDSAVFTGWVHTQQLPDYFAAADVAIFPFDDTLINRTKCSVKLAELLAAGLPVVADAVGQNTEYIQDGETGLLVTPEDDQAFVEAVLRLLGDAALRHRLGQAAAQRTRERFAWPELVPRVERAYAADPPVAGPPA